MSGYLWLLWPLSGAVMFATIVQRLKAWNDVSAYLMFFNAMVAGPLVIFALMVMDHQEGDGND